MLCDARRRPNDSLHGGRRRWLMRGTTRVTRAMHVAQDPQAAGTLKFGARTFSAHAPRLVTCLLWTTHALPQASAAPTITHESSRVVSDCFCVDGSADDR